MLFDRFNVDLDQSDNILVIGGAGGVGSIAIQLLKAKTNLKVIATASREETKAWVKSLGADYVIDHTEDLNMQIKALGLDAPRYIFSTNQTETYLHQISKLIAPQGKFGLIDDPKSLDIGEFKSKSCFCTLGVQCLHVQCSIQQILNNNLSYYIRLQNWWITIKLKPH